MLTALKFLILNHVYSRYYICKSSPSVGVTKAACQRYQFMDEILWKLLGKYYIAVKILQMCKSRGIADIIIISVTFLDVTPYLWRDVLKKIISAP